MKTYTLAVIAVFSAGILMGQNGAYVEYKVASSKGPNGTVKIKYSEFGSSSEFHMIVPEMGGGFTSKNLIKKTTPDVVYTINDKLKSYSETKINETTSDDPKTYVVKKIGEEKVNGYKCVHAMVTEGNETHEVWNTKDIKDFDKYSEAFRHNKKVGSLKREQALKAAGCDGLPVKTIHKGNEKEGDLTMELVKLEKTTFSTSDFELPAGYSKGASSAGGTKTGAPGVKSQEEIMKMSPEERAKYIEELKKQYGK
ncbi:MAG: hypothetical protein K0S32_4581 [Bacteroidetes bacterium]|jgi:hypothetical protein|nr:hypothetical protein [Bacteroidota bacterium]